MKFSLDLAQLKTKYLANTMAFHPDFAGEIESDKAAALDKTSLNNAAFNVLNNPQKRTEYILKLAKLLEEKGSEIAQDFLMEMMELNEEVMELSFDFSQSTFDEVSAKLASIQKNIEEALLVAQYQADEAVPFSEEWFISARIVKDNFLKQKYLLHTLEQFRNIAPH